MIWLRELEMATSLPSVLQSSPFTNEEVLLKTLGAYSALLEKDEAWVKQLATTLVEKVRGSSQNRSGIEAFMQQFSLSSEEGVVLMCLAEALLRIPDAETADRLIADKLAGRDWGDHVGQSHSLFVNASAWGLMLTGRFVELSRETVGAPTSLIKRLIGRSGEPVVRAAMKQAMRIMGGQFVLGRTIAEALRNATPAVENGSRFSFDMLGESAMTADDAERYFASYEAAVRAIGASARGGDVFAQPSISVKLSALHPRYDEKARDACVPALVKKLTRLCVLAKSLNLGLTIDAEEAARLDVSLVIIEKLAELPELRVWNGLGLAVQAYGRRAKPTLEWLADLANRTGRILPVRLVKGAYWDTEIKRAQEGGYESFPVFTRKVSTDVSYLACARYLLPRRDCFYPQFATHNAQTIAAVHVMAGENRQYEFQRLFGMGEALYNAVAESEIAQSVRIYAPVGSHEDLLAYLVRRLLENGANTSFVNRIADEQVPVSAMVASPTVTLAQTSPLANPRISSPPQLFFERKNSSGVAMWHGATRDGILAGIKKELSKPFAASALIEGKAPSGMMPRPVLAPQDNRIVVGQVSETPDHVVLGSIESAAGAQPDWCRRGGEARAAILDRAADLYEKSHLRLMALLIREAGKTLDNAQADLREAVDFLRYYASRARAEFERPATLPGPTGEQNEVSLHGRGVFACISPWNFPLAIFAGQVAAALAAGNSVIAKPAEQTPLVAHEAVKLLLEAGVPPDVLHFLPGDGARIGGLLLREQSLAGVAFTGSNATASLIARALAAKPGPIASLIAETGGMNAMIMDSSALAEQAVRDVVSSAFDSAGQRCSAARIFFVQEDVADRVTEMLRGAMAELRIGDPLDYATDIGPVIDLEARDKLNAHKTRISKSAKMILDMALPDACNSGTFVSPAAYELADLVPLQEEVFGPILHVVRYQASHLQKVVETLNDKGFGLTLGLHTRIEQTVDTVRRLARVGNLYVNRNQIGAVVGAQPFGGEGLSGTGPKAGGPRYLHRFAVERVMSRDTTASGGNAALMAMDS
jgi:RHH-type transcriptional regulator, proline utilization regulon repressor / proline dehydrogenase / delta 1-pyrroline-5-carboxylate dehydrogenase